MDYVPETERLTLEEMDVVFGSVGVADAVSLLFFIIHPGLEGYQDPASGC